jgi:uncharacterized SAM-binding protein YcdF (DUF218 family)
MRKLSWVALLTFGGAGVLALALALTSGSVLIRDEPRHADVIVVLAGETERRPERGFELLSQNFAPLLILDVPAATTIYRWNQMELAQKYLDNLPKAGAASVCPVYAQSTKGEAHDVSHCLDKLKVHSVVLVTSEYHTRRALSIFKHSCPQYAFSVAAAYDDREFGTRWWRHRQWAKINLDEWLRLLWWEAVDRWH